MKKHKTLEEIGQEYNLEFPAASPEEERFSEMQVDQSIKLVNELMRRADFSTLGSPDPAITVGGVAAHLVADQVMAAVISARQRVIEKIGKDPGPMPSKEFVIKVANALMQSYCNALVSQFRLVLEKRIEEQEITGGITH